MEVGEEPHGSPAEGHGLAVEEGRGGAPRLLAHPAAFFSSRSGASAEGAAGEEDGGGRPGHGGVARRHREAMAARLAGGGRGRATQLTGGGRWRAVQLAGPPA